MLFSSPVVHKIASGSTSNSCYVTTSPEGDKYAVCDWGRSQYHDDGAAPGSIRVVHVGSGKVQLSRKSESSVGNCCFSNDGRLMAASESFKKISIWNLDERRRTDFEIESSASIKALAFNETASELYFAKHNSVGRFQLEEGTVDQVVAEVGGYDEISDLQLSPDGACIAVISKSGFSGSSESMTLLKADSLEEFHRSSCATKTSIGYVGFAGNFVVVGDALRHLRSGELAKPFTYRVADVDAKGEHVLLANGQFRRSGLDVPPLPDFPRGLLVVNRKTEKVVSKLVSKSYYIGQAVFFGPEQRYVCATRSKRPFGDEWSPEVILLDWQRGKVVQKLKTDQHKYVVWCDINKAGWLTIHRRTTLFTIYRMK